MKRIAIAALCLLTISSGAWAQSPFGTWLKRAPSTPPMMMIIEWVAPGIKITYRMLGPDGNPMNHNVITVVTALDGKEAPMMMDGKATGQTLATQLLDANRASSVIRLEGKELATSNSEISPDGKTMKVENDFTVSDPSAGKQTEYWDRR